MYEQFLKNWQAPLQAGMKNNPWATFASLGAMDGNPVKQVMDFQRQCAEQVAEMFGLNDTARALTLGMFENTSKLYLATLERQMAWWQSVAAMWTPAAGLVEAPARKASLPPAPAQARPAVARPSPEPVVAAVAAPAEETPDDLKVIAGIGPALEKKLNAEGIVSYRQIAALTESDIARLEETVIKFPGRIQRDGWIEQARALVAGR